MYLYFVYIYMYCTYLIYLGVERDEGGEEDLKVAREM